MPSSTASPLSSRPFRLCASHAVRRTHLPRKTRVRAHTRNAPAANLSHESPLLVPRENLVRTAGHVHGQPPRPAFTKPLRGRVQFDAFRDAGAYPQVSARMHLMLSIAAARAAVLAAASDTRQTYSAPGALALWTDMNMGRLSTEVGSAAVKVVAPHPQPPAAFAHYRVST
jgi:hypothetical protein